LAQPLQMALEQGHVAAFGNPHRLDQTKIGHS
jgi:hypothetical protein